MIESLILKPEDTGTLISKTSHDARNSVRALMELPNWIEDDLTAQGITIPDDVGQHLKLMELHARRVDQMIQDLVIFARVGEVSGPYVEDLSRLLSFVQTQLEVPDGFEVTQDIQVEGVQIPEIEVMTLLDALVSNGIKHHHRSDGCIHVKAVVEGGGYLITVSDDGPGIAKPDYGRVLKAMTTLRPRDAVEGSGMGLAIVSKIVAHYRGTLGLGVGPNLQGSVFEVWLPRPEASKAL